MILDWLFPDRMRITGRLRNIDLKLEKIMVTQTELLEKISAIKSSLAGIRQDITDIKNGLPASGGLTAAEVEGLRVALDEVVTEAAGLDAENPAPASDPVQ